MGHYRHIRDDLQQDHDSVGPDSQEWNLVQPCAAREFFCVAVDGLVFRRQRQVLPLPAAWQLCQGRQGVQWSVCQPYPVRTE